MNILNLKSPTELSGFYIIFNGSTNNETDGYYGVSHLAEHLLTKGMEKHQDQLDMDGVNFNAYTSNNEVVFHITGLESSIVKWRDILLNSIFDVKTSLEDFETEKSIVLEEYTDSFSDKVSSHMLNLDRKLLGSYSPIGRKKDLIDLTHLKYLEFAERFFSKPSKIINVTKSKDYKNNSLSFNEYLTPSTLKREVNNNKSILDINMSLHKEGKSSLIMTSDIIDENFYNIAFINLMLGFGLQSPLYKEVREKNGLVYYINVGMHNLNRKGINSISTMTSEENVPKIVEIVGNIFKNKDKYLTKERFNVIKETMLINKKMSDIDRYKKIQSYISPKEFSVTENLDKIKLKECLDIFDKYYNIDNYYVSNDKKKFGK